MASYEAKWSIVRSLNEGGQAHTFIVVRKDAPQGPEFVLKRNKNPKRELRFRNEIQALRSLDHPSITKIVDVDLDDEKPWYIQPYYEKGDLENYFSKETNVSLERKFDWFIQLCSALQECHSKQIYHRDIKPSNIFLEQTEEQVVLGDFGLCWPSGTGMRLTDTTERIGSWHFMAPEYRDGRNASLSASGDVYSLGKVLYFVLSNGLSFDREEHRNSRWDLVNRNNQLEWPNSLYLEHVNLLLDKMIVYNEDDRIGIDQVVSRAREARRLTLGRYNPLEGKKYSPCKYCGDGNCLFIDPEELPMDTFMGFQPAIGNARKNFRFLVCQNCGHLETFYLPGAEKKWLG